MVILYMCAHTTLSSLYMVILYMCAHTTLSSLYMYPTGRIGAIRRGGAPPVRYAVLYMDAPYNIQGRPGTLYRHPSL